MRRGAKAYLAANFVAQVCALVRFTVLARILGPEELGLAAMLILTSQFFQVVSDTGSDRFIVQDRDGGSPTMQALVQMALAFRGVLIAGGLALSAGWIAALFKQPELAVPMMFLGLAPLILGFIHLDFRRAQRELDFRAESKGTLIAEPLGLAAVTLAAFLTHDASAVIYGLAARSLVLVIVSHLTAERRYNWSFGRAEAARFTTYAAPLFLNGILLFLGSQGDRLLIAHGLGPAALGHYSAVLLLIYYPTTMLVRVIVGFHLPQIARERDNPEGYAHERDKLGGRITVLSIVFLIGFVVAGPIATPILFGPQFVEPLQLFGLIGALQTARFMRVWPTTLANSIGRSTIILANNVARSSCLPIAFVASQVFGTMEAIVIGLFVGEVGALVTSLVLLHRANTLRLSREMYRLGLFVLCGGTAAVAAWALQKQHLFTFFGLAPVALVAIALVAHSERAVIRDAAEMARARLARVMRR